MTRSTDQKLQVLTHYLIARVPPHQLGATKLNKLLWFIDCESYRRTGRSVSGLNAYAKRKYGPAPRHMPKVMHALKSAGQIAETKAPTSIGHSRHEYTAQQPPQIELLSKAEIDLINQVIIDYLSMSAGEISDLSHDALWEETELGKDLPIRQAAFAPRKVSRGTLAWANSEVERLGL